MKTKFQFDYDTLKNLTTKCPEENVLYKTREIAEAEPDVFLHLQDYDSNGARSSVYDALLDHTGTFVVLASAVLGGLQLAHWAWKCCRMRNQSLEQRIEAKDKGRLKNLKMKNVVGRTDTP